MNVFNLLTASVHSAQLPLKNGFVLKNPCTGVDYQLFTMGGKEIPCGHFYFMY